MDGIIALKKAKGYTDDTIRESIEQIPKGVHWKGSVSHFADLPSNPKEGDAYTVLYTGTSGTNPDGTEYAWGVNAQTHEGNWVALGPDISGKQDTLVTGQNIKTINYQSILGSGNLSVDDHTKFANRDTADQHPMSAITGLVNALDSTVKITPQTLTEAQKIQALKNLDGIRIVSLTDTTETLASLTARLDEINNDGQHVFFDISVLGYPLYLCAISIEYDNDIPVSYRVSDMVTQNFSLGAYVASKTIGQILSEAISGFYTLTVTCLTQDGVTVTGQTVTVRERDTSGAVYATAAYNGQPVSFSIPNGFAYYVTVSNDLPAHFNPTVASGIISNANVSVTLTYSDFHMIRRFKDIQEVLNSDIDLTDLVGQQVTSTRGGAEPSWDIADYDEVNKVITLLLHDTLSDNRIYEPSQALMWCENGLAAGAYTFKDGSTRYYFTLAQDIPEGGQLKATTSAFTTYESQATTVALENGTVSTTEIAGATDLGTCATGLLNHMDRVNYGSNNFKESFMFQFLNSDAAPNTNLIGDCVFSRPQTVGNYGGFLYGFDAESLACVADTEWKCSANNIYEVPAELGGECIKSTAYTVTAKFALASQKEIFGSYDGVDAGDKIFGLYVGAENEDRIKYYGTSARWWWLRSPTPSRASYERIVYTSGAVTGNRADVGYGVVPACKIRKST